ncbi:methionine--tRNA ligase, cytoplasmic-like [Macadamia integrifolia]|uniref:methionine--tRNA ligase, cytoplasmic-like n=1 Tax=Macadamia integrifolia TaxID=60698 RepID=UPI001C52A462|nr:methionine--tRNA ligase, cytoplasmic-like [Macadamia integrifolia]
MTKKLAEKVSDFVDQYIEAMEKDELKKGLKTAMTISSEGNAYLQDGDGRWSVEVVRPSSLEMVIGPSSLVMSLKPALWSLRGRSRKP